MLEQTDRSVLNSALFHSSQKDIHLNLLKNSHKLWRNPLLIACEAGQLKKEDFQYLFSQYHFYSKNFTRLLAACMTHCDNDLFW